MKEFSDIIYKLIAEEKLGILHSITSVSQYDLELHEKLSEETINESTIIRGKYFDHDESNIKSTPDSDSLEGNLTNVNGNYFNTKNMKNLKKTAI